MNSTEEGPDPADIQAWRRMVENGSYKSVSHQSLVAAAQSMGPFGDQRILNPIMLEIGDRTMRILRKRIGRNHRNQGYDAIERAHGQLIEAVLKPQSADGSALRTAFVSTVRYRAADAIRREQLETARFSEPEEDETTPTTTCSQPASDMEESAQVESVLRNVRDPRKRLAFRLYMDGVPRNSTKAESIASSLSSCSWRSLAASMTRSPESTELFS